MAYPQPDLAEWRTALRLDRPVDQRWPGIPLPLAMCFFAALMFCSLAFGVN